jgi:hypothetical protein
MEKPKLTKRINQLPLKVQIEIVKETNEFIERRVNLYEKIGKIVAETKPKDAKST